MTIARAGRTPKEQRAYLAAYMRRYKREVREGKRVRQPRQEFTPEPRRPAYDPLRDGPLPYASLSAMILGDPPIGRRAIDR